MSPSRLPRVGLAIGICLGAGSACKVPLLDINAGFVTADASWFANEETLFVFYELGADQGLGDDSVLEIRYTTDDGTVGWTSLAELPAVHTHLSIDCGFESRCGSRSLHVPREPRQVGLRLRYHREGEISLEANTLLNIVGSGPAHSHRSLLVYGVFDESNRAIQWRSRHRFPTIRNEEAERLGLRRRFTIEAQRFGDDDLGTPDNPYAYGVECPPQFAGLELATVETDERAVFNVRDLPSAASSAAMVCADATAIDATGPFTTRAVAQKNPEVRPAFPVLRSPVRDATPIKYLLSVCERSISSDHLAMQRQRLFLDGVSPVCVDNWMNGTLADELAARFREDIERVRADGHDMVLSIAIHHDTPGLGAVLEEVLSTVLATDRDRTTPRVAGAFLLDSYGYHIDRDDLRRTAIWCPARLPDLDELEDVGSDASLVCAIVIDNPSLSLGPFDFGTLPIFPSRSMYLDFIDQYSDDQAGNMKSLAFRVPELPASANHVRLGDYGVATFLNGEVITADADDAFSFCNTDEYAGFVFRSADTPELMPVDTLPEWHEMARSGMAQQTYELGIVWDFPFLLHIEYEIVLAGSVSAFSASLPFGIGVDAEEFLGSDLWTTEEFPLAETLTQCRRFCDHPTFDSAGVYQVTQSFRAAYLAACYAPKYPRRSDSGFPHDP